MTVAPFDACGPLPSGVTVLEASAGTGKTFTIAALATRYVAGGLPLEHLLIVTFTRMATSELRDRVRERMVSAEQGLSRVLLGAGPDPADDVLGLLACGPEVEVRRRRDRLSRALSDFDAATIATTHGFCQHVLNGLGVAGDVERDVAFVEDPRYLVDEVVADLYVRFFHRPDHPAKFTLAQALRIGELAVGNPDAALMPADAPHNSTPQLRFRLATRVRQEVDRRRRLAAALTYDDLLTRLRDTLADPVRGDTACRRLRERYKVTLVDEFQDTDPIQWEIMRRAFTDPGSTLVLIGDPKQAIYSFRGADVYAYLEAARMAAIQATLEVNWRSDQGLLDAFDSLFAGARLGHEGIVYRDVRAAPANAGRRQAGPPLRVRVLQRDDGLVGLTAAGYASLGDSRAIIATDLAGDVVRLLTSRSEVAGRPVRPGDIAVLVHRNRDASAVRDALDDAGVPAVVNGAGSVFGTASVQAWLRLLAALERPASASTARLAALSPFIGWSAQRVALAGEAEWEGLHARLHRWAAVLRLRGVAALFETISRAERLDRRVLERSDGERRLTDLRHVGQLLHGVATAEQLGVTALTGWLRARIDEAGEEDDAEDRSRRLESDAEAVQVLTIYRSKGLEFPIVYCPYLWDPGYIPDDEPPVFHGADGRRTIDVGGDGGPNTVTGWAHIAERRGEELRLAYVALTRARHQAVLWWAGTYAVRDSALCRLLFFKDAEGDVAPEGNRTPTDDQAVARFEELGVSVERVDGGSGAVWVGREPDGVALSVGRFDRTLDPAWRRTSYSGITSGVHEARVGSEEEERREPDEVVVAPTADDPADEPALRAVPSLLATMPGGADVGTFVHGVLERADFTAADLDAELWASLQHTAAREAVDVGDRSLIVTGLAAAVETPLGPAVEDVRLRDIRRRDRVDELGFELPLCGGDAPVGSLATEAIGTLLSEHLPAGDPFLAYASRLSDPVLQTGLRGYLSGSLDLVLRTPDRRYAVVDYKTNWLGIDDEPLSAWHYRPAAMLDAMYAAHYPLQALLYTVALHRYLRWRVRRYDVERDVAGVLYLFVRGMVGAATPRLGGVPCGVFGWLPPASLVEALSDLLDRGAP
ncbi:MAG TPA: UvrD-helicase domain-containing protein [Acidimicrobiales bacterium]|nr:UvrD-helicase domain-containing protein [Acidimicrobiales bacterium]